MKLAPTKMMPLDDIIPYWRNPRRLTDEAVNAVVVSLTQYGYQQPIVVDAGNVIIAGHTRYTAMRRMGVKEVAVSVADDLTPEQVKQFRLIDNKAGEYSTWDFDKLTTEVVDMDPLLAQAFFAEVVGAGVEFAENTFTSDYEDEEEEESMDVDFTCPSCFHSWEMTVTPEALAAGILKVEN